MSRSTLKPVQGRGNAALFSDPEMNIRSTMHECAGKSLSRLRKVARKGVTVKKEARQNGTLLPGIIDGERVLVAESLADTERAVEIRVRVALAADGVLVMKHSVERCPHCGERPRTHTGLGKGASDLICVVPPYGRFLGIEMKRPGYSPSDVTREQRCWLVVVRRFGGVTGVASSVEEAMALVALARVLP